MKACILAIGDELISGSTVDTNSAYLSRELAALGVETVSHTTVPDQIDSIVAAIHAAATKVDIVIITGGLGPTEDDLTRQALAQAMECELQIDEDCLKEVESFFIRIDRPMCDANRIQAMIPTKATYLPNSEGTAPGITGRVGNATVYVMPGVPREMFAMFENHVRPALPTSGRAIVQIMLHTFGAGESNVGEKLADLMTCRDSNLKVGTTVSDGLVSIRITSAAENADAATARANSTADDIANRLGDFVIGRADDTLQSVLIDTLRRNGRTLATAESCTGGMVGQLITSVSGASDCYLGGVVTYSNEMKHRLLGVDNETLQAHGAVSEQVAREMAEGCRHRLGSDFAVSITGIAGPTGGTQAKPVGLVYIAVAGPDGTDVHHRIFMRDRSTIRHRAAMAAMNHVRLAALAALGKTSPA